jgi:polar amino acid transport system substrate-binding protein
MDIWGAVRCARVRTMLAASLAVVCAATPFVLSAQSTPLLLVSTAWPPFTNDAGQARFALDLVETALGRISLSSTTTIVSAGEFTALLTSGRFDGSAAVWRDAQREEVLLFSEPYLENRLVLVGRRDADVSATSLRVLAGKRIAIVEGYSYGDAVDLSGAVLLRTRSEEDSLDQLLKGNVDYTLMDDLVVQFLVSTYPKEADTRLAIGSTPLVTRPLHFAIRRTRPDAQSIITRFNAQIRGMISDRTYHRLLQVEWIRADVNGDGVSENVPATDRPGPDVPKRVYALFSVPTDTLKTPGFYVGGNIYSYWASVPEAYRNLDTKNPDPRRSTASIFHFSW